MKAGFVGLVGYPNSGKSTFMNTLIKEKVAIVTPKPQTTRRRVHGIVNPEGGQIIFVDAPGLVKPKGGINPFLAQELEDVIINSDVLLFVLSTDLESPEKVDDLLKFVSKKKPWMALITKTDMKAHRIPIIRQKLMEAGCQKIFEFSIKKEFEADEFQKALLTELPESPKPLFDTELYTTENVRDLIAEIVREKCFLHLSQEVPYYLGVRIKSYDEGEEIDKISLQIMVEKESQVSIVVGKSGQVIKQIGTEARQEAEALLGKKVFLDLQVNHKEKWTENKGLLKELGYVTEKDSHHR